MEVTDFSPMETLADLQPRVALWRDTLDPINLSLALGFLVVIILARAPLSGWLVSLLHGFLGRLSLSFNDQVKSELTRTTSILIVTFAVLIVLETLNPPSLPGDVIRRILASVAVIAIFSSWYNLSGPFVSLLQTDGFTEIRVESQWMERVARFGILIFAITAILKVWQVDISAALTGVGVLGAGMAIATQDLIRNLVAGMNNMSENRFAVGDAIQVEGLLVGTVEAVDLRSTLIRGFDQIPRYVPNSELSNAVVLNYTHRQHRRVMLSIPLVLSSTQDQILQVRDALRDYLETSGDFELSDAAAKYIYVEGLSDSAVPLMFYAWTTNGDYVNFLEVNERLTLKILEIVAAAGTALAYPTQSVRLSQEEGGPHPA